MNYNLDEESDSEDSKMSLLEMSDKLTELWQSYFAAPKKSKAPLMEEYNKLAEAYNKKRGAKLMLLLTPATKDSIRTRPVKEPEIVQGEEEEMLQQDVPKADPKPGSIISQIIDLHKQGLTNKEIIAKGFNKSTVGRQVSEYKKRKENGSE